MITRRLFIKYAAIGTSAMALGGCYTLPRSKRPNVVLIMADDIGVECFGCYGSNQYKTPRIDELAASGIRFNHCYSQPLCTPSRVQIMTGKNNIRNYFDFEFMLPTETTFAHTFKDAGYATGCAGKWQLYGAEHLGDMAAKGMHPSKAGFDEYCLWHLNIRTERYWGPSFEKNGDFIEYPKDVFGPDVCCDFVCDFIERHKSRPFLLYYPMMLVHSPFVMTRDFRNEQAGKQEKFEAMVGYMDKIVGKISDKLKEAGLLDNTLLIFAGDNGTGRDIKSSFRGVMMSGGKGKTNASGTNVPLVVNMPGAIPSGRVSDDLVDFSDFFPTLCEWCSIPVDDTMGLDGLSFAAELRGTVGKTHSSLVCYYNSHPSERNKEVRYAFDRDWKLYSDGRLYDLRNDIAEKNPVQTTSPEIESIRKTLSYRLNSLPAKAEKLNLSPEISITDEASIVEVE